MCCYTASDLNGSLLNFIIFFIRDRELCGFEILNNIETKTPTNIDFGLKLMFWYNIIFFVVFPKQPTL